MQTLFDNFLSFVLLLILVVSPVQNTIASVNHTMTMVNTEMDSGFSSKISTMQHEMPVSTRTDMQDKHCPGHQTNQCHCDMSHCTTVSLILLPTLSSSLSLNDTHASFNISTDTDIIQSVPSSFFRPPRV